MQDERSGGHRPGAAPRANGAHTSSHIRPVPFDELPDEPIDLVAVQADDELINALASGMSVSSPGFGGYDADDQVAALLAAWKADVDAEPVPELVDLDTAVSRVRAASRLSGRRLRLVVPIAAAAVVALSVAEAKDALSRGEPAVAAEVLAAAEGDLVAVRAEEGAAELAALQSFLEAKAAETPPGRPTQPGAPLASDPTRPVPPGAVTGGPVTTVPGISPPSPTTRPAPPTTSPDPSPLEVEQPPAVPGTTPPGNSNGAGNGTGSGTGTGTGAGTPTSPLPSATVEGMQDGGTVPPDGTFGASRTDGGAPPSASGPDTASTPTN